MYRSAWGRQHSRTPASCWWESVSWPLFNNVSHIFSCDNDQDKITTCHATCSGDEVEDGDIVSTGPSAQVNRNHGEGKLKKGAAKGKSGYFGVHMEKTRKVDPWQLYMTLPIPSAYHEPGKSKSRYKFLGFYSSAESASRVHDQVAYHVLGRR